MTTQLALLPCEHCFAGRHKPGHRLYWVRQCMICHEVDWDDLDREVGKAVADALQAATREHLAEQDAVHADLALLLRTLGMGDHARPASSHEVMLEAIAEVARMAGIGDLVTVSLADLRTVMFTDEGQWGGLPEEYGQACERLKAAAGEAKPGA